MRPPHKLTAARRADHPAVRCFFDSESYVDPVSGAHTPYLIVANFVDEYAQRDVWTVFRGPDCSENFWAAVAAFPDPGRELVVYAHNAGYDLLVTGGIIQLAKRNFRVQSWFEKGTVFIMQFAGDVTQIRVLSTSNYFSGTLKDLGKTLGLPKLEFDVLNVTDPNAAVPYCRRDVEIIKLAMENFYRFVSEHDFGRVAATISGQAFTAFKRRFMTVPVFIHAHENVLALERAAYCGGRVECFRVGRLPGPVYYLDVNSMYPHCMRSFTMPTKYRYYRQRLSIKNLIAFLTNYLAVAMVTVSTDVPLYPLRAHGKLIFPVGTFETVLCTPELKMAIDRGHLVSVGETALYDGGELFAAYVDTFYQLRQTAKETGDQISDALYKLFMNGLYGKFGQLTEAWDRIGDEPYDHVYCEETWDAVNQVVQTYKVFGGSRFLQGETGESFDSFPAVAAHVTAYARRLLAEYIETAGWENVFYADTDSLFVSEAGYQNLSMAIHNTGLGALKLENFGDIPNPNDDVYLYAPKDYRFGRRTKQKGVKKSAIALDDTNTKFTQSNWARVTGSIRAGNLSAFAVTRGEKTLARNYEKGTVFADGTVVPYQLTIKAPGEIIKEKR